MRRIGLLMVGILLALSLPAAALAATTATTAAATPKDNLCAGAGGEVAANGKCVKDTTVFLTGGLTNLTDTLLFAAGAIAVIIIIIAGIRYVTSTGDAARVKAAKDTLLYAIVGLVIVILAYAIVHFVSSSIKLPG